MRSIFMTMIVSAGLAACGGGSEKPEASAVVAASESPAAPPNLLQTQTDALQKARDMQAQMEQAEKQRQKDLDAMTGN